MVDELIRQAETEPLTSDTLRTIVGDELRKWADEKRAKPSSPKSPREKVKV